MRVTACSIFRNSAHYVDRYMWQMDRLAERVDLRLVLTYGDCTDNTRETLENVWGARHPVIAKALGGVSIRVSRCDHNGPDFGSVDNPQRWDQIAQVVSHTLDLVGDPGDALIWVESDLLWEARDMMTLLEDLDQVPAVAPRVIADDGVRWYDVWGYRQNGRMFNAQPPYLPDGTDLGDKLVKIDSCGSCWVTSGGYWKEWSGHWPYTAGGDLWLDPRTTVRHP